MGRGQREEGRSQLDLHKPSHLPLGNKFSKCFKNGMVYNNAQLWTRHANQHQKISFFLIRDATVAVPSLKQQEKRSHSRSHPLFPCPKEFWLGPDSCISLPDDTAESGMSHVWKEKCRVWQERWGYHPAPPVQPATCCHSWWRLEALLHPTWFNHSKFFLVLPPHHAPPPYFEFLVEFIAWQSNHSINGLHSSLKCHYKKGCVCTSS